MINLKIVCLLSALICYDGKGFLMRNASLVAATTTAQLTATTRSQATTGMTLSETTRPQAATGTTISATTQPQATTGTTIPTITRSRATTIRTILSTVTRSQATTSTILSRLTTLNRATRSTLTPYYELDPAGKAQWNKEKLDIKEPWPRETGGKTPIIIGFLTNGWIIPMDNTVTQFGFTNDGAITIAVEEINNSTEILPNHTLQFVVATTSNHYAATEAMSIMQTTRLFTERNVTAIIGPPASCAIEGRLAGLFNTPMVSYYCTDPDVSDPENRDQYPTFAHIISSGAYAALALISLLQKYSWTEVALLKDIHDKPNSPNEWLYQDLKERFQQYQIEVRVDMTYSQQSFFDWDSPYNENIDQTINEFKDKARIILLVGNPLNLAGLVYRMGRKQLLESGEYFFVCVDTEDSYNQKFPHLYTAAAKTGEYWNLHKYYRNMAYLFRSQIINPNFNEFNRQVQEYCITDPFNYPDSALRQYVRDVRFESSARLYDAVHAVAKALNEAIKDKKDYTDGSVVMQRLTNRTYPSKTGYSFYIQENGDALTLWGYTLLQTKENIWSNNGSLDAGIYPVAKFTIQSGTSDPPPMEFIDGLRSVRFLKGVPLSEPTCGFNNEKCGDKLVERYNDLEKFLFAIAIGLAAALLSGLIAVAVITIRSRQTKKPTALEELDELLYVKHTDVLHSRERQVSVFAQLSQLGDSHTPGSSGYSKITWGSITSLGAASRDNLIQVGRFNGQWVTVQKINKQTVEDSAEIRQELKQMKNVRHDNLVQFIRVCKDPGFIMILTELCPKGSLQDVLTYKDLALENIFVESLIFDILNGLQYIHANPHIRYHGNFTSEKCVIDSRWTLKITGCDFRKFKQGEILPDWNSEQIAGRYLLWKSPEKLRKGSFDKEKELTVYQHQKSDIYSLGIVMYEICGGLGPFGEYHIDFSALEIVKRVSGAESPPFRPRAAELAEKYDTTITNALRVCWSEIPEKRPNVKTLKLRLKPLRSGDKGLLDKALEVMAVYAKNLEENVNEKARLIHEEKQKADDLLHAILPKSVAAQLKRGESVEAEAFKCVTVYFSDICGFTQLASESTPIEVVELLNSIYTQADLIIEEYDVYKVETIGDGYVVVSGLPKRNGELHAGEIASMSLHFLEAIKSFKIPHRPQKMLELRIGIHSGPCVAGVIGRKMPRYCLFGDTVNTASRYESTGEPLKIHCSSSTKAILEKLGGYYFEERGYVEMKGKGKLLTYWVTGENKTVRAHRLTGSRPSMQPGWQTRKSFSKSEMARVGSSNPDYEAALKSNHGSEPAVPARLQKPDSNIGIGGRENLFLNSTSAEVPVSSMDIRVRDYQPSHERHQAEETGFMPPMRRLSLQAGKRPFEKLSVQAEVLDQNSNNPNSPIMYSPDMEELLEEQFLHLKQRNYNKDIETEPLLSRKITPPECTRLNIDI